MITDQLAHRLTGGNRHGVFRVGFIERRARVHHFTTSQYSLNYIHEGSGCYVHDDGSRHPLQPGSVIRRLPDVPHVIEWQEDQRYGVVAVPAEALDLLRLCGAFRSSAPVFQIEADDQLPATFSALGQALDTSQGADFATVVLDMLGLIVDLHRREQVAEDKQTDDAQMLTAMATLASKLDERLSLPQLAAQLGMSYPSFRKRFRRHAGVSPGEFRIRRRIEAALAMLTDPTLSVGTIAERLGYPDIYSFSLQFKKKMGLSPQTWRANMEG